MYRLHHAAAAADNVSTARVCIMYVQKHTHTLYIDQHLLLLLLSL